MFISICTQIKNRLYQFSKIFAKNIEILQKYSDIEWVIVDYSSSDNLDSYIMEYIEQYNFLKYYQTTDKNQNYSLPVAKNLTVRLSSGNYVFNLDCDNYLDNIIEQIQNTDQGVYCNEYLKGTYGRIGLHKEIFIKVGGYDEYLYPASVHDNDLLLRCGLAGYNFKNIPSVTPAIHNTKLETVSMFNSDLSWEKMKEYNEIIMKYNERKKIINPNNNIFTPCSLLFNFKETVIKTHEF